MRVFLDANILFSAAKSDGAIRKLLELLATKGWILVADNFVAEEAGRNLALKAPDALADLDRLLRSVEVHAAGFSTPLPAGLREMLAEKDRPVLSATIRPGCDALVTGDRTHFGPLMGTTVEGVAIHSPASLFGAVLGGKGR